MGLKRSALVGGMLLGAAMGVIVRVRRHYHTWLHTTITQASSQSRILRTSCGDVEYAVRGQGPAVLICHGGGGGYDHGLLFQELLFDGSGFTVIAVSRAGYLRTPIETARTPADLADVYAELLDALQIRQAAIVGISAGGVSALQFALRHPQRCWALIMACGISQAMTLPRSIQRLRRLLLSDTTLWLLNLHPRVLEQYAHSMLKILVREPQQRAQVLADPHKMQWLLRLVAVGGPAGLRIPGMEHDETCWDGMPPIALEQIATPTLVVHGTDDPIVPFSHGATVAERVPNAELLNIPKGGHMFMLTHPDTASQLTGFLTTHIPVPV